MVDDKREQRAAYLLVDPNPVPHNAGAGATTISWSTGDGSPGEVYVSANGGPEKLFARGAEGFKEAPWIHAGRMYEFRLYTGTDRNALLSTATVTRSSGKTLFELYRMLVQDGIPNKYYELALKRLLEGASAETASPERLFGKVSDDFWLWLHTEGYRQSQTLRKILPEIPDEDMQLTFHGTTGDAALIDGFAISRWVKQIFEAHAWDFRTCGNVLDFGCGWGRVIRFFLKDIEPVKLWGIDANNRVIEFCKRTNEWCNFKLVEPFPPTLFPENMFDLVYCYSVFSHLAEDTQQAWLKEFSRILKPGGLLIATTWPRDFIVQCDEARRGTSPAHRRNKHLAAMFLDAEQWLANYDSGNYCFDSPTEVYGGISHWFGDACIPKSYVLEQWTKHFNFLDFVESRNMCPQNVIVVRK